MSKIVNLVVARDLNFGIGYNGKIPWRCSEDMHFFKKTTTTTKDAKKQNAVIMGRVTWESLKEKSLTNRVNICLSKSPQLIPTCQTLKAAVEYANSNPLVESIFIIGGSGVYREALETLNINTIYQTIIKKIFPSDRKVQFITKYLKNYKNNSIITENSEYIIWKYSKEII